jgi:alpha-beta hydrolase superfamily lysophospholipase
VNVPNSLVIKSKAGNKDLFQSRIPSFTYSHIYIVAHSLGAIVTRLALNRAHKLGKNWPHLTEMILFAPAHMGARVDALSSLSKLVFPPSLRFLPVFGFFKIVTIDDVDIRSKLCILHSLKKQTQKLQADPGHKFSISKKVYVAEIENIVHNDDFLKDPPATQIDGKTHTSICKPSRKYPEPIDVLAALF